MPKLGFLLRAPTWLIFAGVFSLGLSIAAIWYSYPLLDEGHLSDAGGRQPFMPILFRPDMVTAAPQTLAALAIIAAMMERSTEVLFSTGRGAGRKRQLELISGLIDQQKDAERDENSLLRGPQAEPGFSTKLNEVRERKANLKYQRAKATEALRVYRANTKTWIQAFSILFATLVGLAGVRALSPLLVITWDTVNIFQWTAIQLADIAFTVFLLVGGAGGLHRVISIIGRAPASDAIANVDRATTP